MIFNETAAIRRHRNCSQRTRSRGFTLIETALATIIVGVGVIAIMGAQQAFHQKNSWSTHSSIGMRLANEIREMSLNLPRHDPVTDDAFWGYEANEAWVGDFDDLDDFDGDAVNPPTNGLIFSAASGTGPINARREVIENMDGWTQTVRVFNVDPFDITSEEDDNTTSMLAVEVIVTYQGPNDLDTTEVTRLQWISGK